MTSKLELCETAIETKPPFIAESRLYTSQTPWFFDPSQSKNVLPLTRPANTLRNSSLLGVALFIAVENAAPSRSTAAHTQTYSFEMPRFSVFAPCFLALR
jgi:hypothetical protein